MRACECVCVCVCVCVCKCIQARAFAARKHVCVLCAVCVCCVLYMPAQLRRGMHTCIATRIGRHAHR